jgi:tetratricopeptide (TPR) repeat protein
MRRLLWLAVFLVAGCGAASAADPCVLAKSALAVGNQSLNHYSKGDLAVAAFQQATQLSPDCEPAWLGLGSSYARRYVPYWRGNLSVAIRAGQSAEEAQKAADEANVRAIAAASDAFEKALAVNPKSVDAVKRLADLYTADNDWQQAKPWFARAIEQEPNDKNLYESRAELMGRLIGLRDRERKRIQSYDYGPFDEPSKITDTQCRLWRSEDSEQLDQGIDDFRKVAELNSSYDRAMWALNSFLTYRAALHCGDPQGGAEDRKEAKIWLTRASEIVNRRIQGVRSKSDPQ